MNDYTCGPFTGIQISKPINQIWDIGLGYCFALAAISPNGEQLVLNKELDKIMHFFQHEFSLSNEFLTVNRNNYALVFSADILVNNYAVSQIIDDYFIDNETGLRSYASDFEIGNSIGLNASVINYCKLTNYWWLGVKFGYSAYLLSDFNSLKCSIVFTYKMKKQ